MALNSKVLAPNPAAAAESAQTLIFPAQSSIQKEIPLYLRFVCTEYSAIGIARNGYGGLGIGRVKANIYVPVPSKLVTQTAMRYKQESNEDVMRGVEQEFAEDWLATKISRLSVAGMGGLTRIFPRIGGIAALAATRLPRALSQTIDTDYTETILQSGSKRSFTISLYMPCLNYEDSVEAARITRAFEALSLPTLLGAGISALAGVQLHFHPPMWFFGIGELNPTQVNSDIDWTSQPQASVLTNVAVSRTAIDATSFTALDYNIKPVAYSVTLNFQEIETAFRRTAPTQGTSFEIANRSGALLTLGQYTNAEGNPITMPGG